MTVTAAKHLSVLYVEDDPVLRDLFAGKLAILGIVRSVVPCATPRDDLLVTVFGPSAESRRAASTAVSPICRFLVRD